MHLRMLACTLLVSCGGTGKAIYGPRSGDGVSIESVEARTRTEGFYSAGCWLEGMLKNPTEISKLIEITAEAVTAENRWLGSEKHRVAHIVQARADVPARARRAYEVRIPVSSCDKLMYVTIQNVTATPN